MALPQPKMNYDIACEIAQCHTVSTFNPMTEQATGGAEVIRRQAVERTSRRKGVRPLDRLAKYSEKGFRRRLAIMHGDQGIAPHIIDILPTNTSA